MPRPRSTGPSPGLALLLLDAGLAFAAWPLAAALVLWGMPAEARPGLPALALYPVACIAMLYASGLYRRDALLETRRSVGRVPFAVLLGSLLATLGVALLPPPIGATGSALLLAAAVPCFVATAAIARGILFALRKRGSFERRLLVIGAGARAHDLVVLLRREAGTLAYDITLLPEPSGAVDPRLAEDSTCRILPPDADYLATAQEFGADQIVVAPDERRGLPMEALIACRTAGFPVYEYLAFLEREIGRVDIKRLELGWLLFSDGFTFGPLDRLLKRLLDIAASATLLTLSAPFLAAAALAVKLQDGGPALYRQRRVTMGGRVFEILKLRTMRIDAERAGAVWAQASDPRITKLGHFLRRSRLDELPQLINVLRGDMSFVGPRPERPEFIAELARQLPLYNERHVVRAGLTGWAQVNYPYGASLDDSRSKLSYDLYYVKNFGVLFDLLIILQTLRVVLWPGNTVR
jgi:sugar transferase (PEP-CTERM system associated)